MRRIWLALAIIVALAGIVGGVLAGRKVEAEPSAKPAPPAEARPEPVAGVWQPPAGLSQVPIWPGPAPDLGGAPLPSERILTVRTPEALAGPTSQGVYDVTVPTMTLYPPKGRNTGVAVVVFPGGGFEMLAVTIEGTEICDWLSSKGITCILSKYRVPDSNEHWDEDCRCRVTPKVLTALQDAQRTIRLVRSRAKTLGVDPNKIGVMGFSAGGYLVAETSNIFEPAYKPVDAVDKVSSRPDFAIAAYPGHLWNDGETLNPAIKVTKQTPPTFLLQNWDDPVDDICNSTLYARALSKAGVPAEVHLFARGGHAFGLRHPNDPAGAWPSLVERWLKDIGML